MRKIVSNILLVAALSLIALPHSFALAIEHGENISEFVETTADNVGWVAGDLLSSGAECRSIATIRDTPVGRVAYGGIFVSGDVKAEYTQLYQQKDCDNVIAKANALQEITGECGTFLLDAGCHLDKWWKGILEGLGELMWLILSWIAWIAFYFARFLLWIGATLLDNVMVYLVFEMGSLINLENGVRVAWALLRDLANVLLIAGFVMVGFSTILQVANYAADKLLVRLIISALLVNFSFFFAGAVIDASNYLATEVYKSNTTQEFCKDKEGLSLAGEFINVVTYSNLCSVSSQVMNDLKIGTWAEIKDLAGDSNKALAVIGFMGAIFAAILGFIFFSMAILLISRFVALTILLITSPIGIAGSGLPYIGDWAKKWQDAFVPQALFAPIFFVLLALALTLIKSLSSVLGTGDATYSTIASGEQSAALEVIPLMMFFAISIGFLYAALSISQSLSKRGGDFMGINKVYEKLNGKLGGIYGNAYQGTFGRATQGAQRAVSFAYDKTAGRLAKVPLIGGLATTVGTAITPSRKSKPFGATQTVDELTKSQQEYYKNTKRSADDNAINKLWRYNSPDEKKAKVHRMSKEALESADKSFVMKNAKHFTDQQLEIIKNRKDITEKDLAQIVGARQAPIIAELDKDASANLTEIAKHLGEMSDVELQMLFATNEKLRYDRRILMSLKKPQFDTVTANRELYKTPEEAKKAAGVRMEALKDGGNDAERKHLLSKVDRSELVSLGLAEVKNAGGLLTEEELRHVYNNSRDAGVRQYIATDPTLKERLVGPGMQSMGAAIQAAIKTPPQTGPGGATGPTPTKQ